MIFTPQATLRAAEFPRQRKLMLKASNSILSVPNCVLLDLADLTEENFVQSI